MSLSIHFRASSIALFARRVVVFTPKLLDVWADLVGKVEAGIRKMIQETQLLLQICWR
jgi:Na+/H+-translocating membrane pyrophosphatase